MTGDVGRATSGIPAFISVTSKQARSSRESFFRGVERQTEDRGQKRRNAVTNREEDRAREMKRKRESRSIGPRDARLVRARVCRASYPNPTQAVGGIKRSTEAR